MNLRRVRLRQLRKASEEFLMAATAQNLKRLVKHLRRLDAPPTMATARGQQRGRSNPNPGLAKDPHQHA
jgi:hypothetical protein